MESQTENTKMSGQGFAQNTSEAAKENWLPLLDYAVVNGLSTSTLRRYIKAKKVEYKILKGRYLIRNDANTKIRERKSVWGPEAVQEGVTVFQKVRELETKLASANEQISELKMLVAIYEEKLAQRG